MGDKRPEILPTSTWSLAVPLFLLAAITIATVYMSGSLRFGPPSQEVTIPVTVTILQHQFSYRLDGEYIVDGVISDAPKYNIESHPSLVITKYQISSGHYAICVREGDCFPAESSAESFRIPATGVGYDDAVNFARWLSKRTGYHWRLPTDREVAFASGTAFPDDALGLGPDNKNPALRWIAEYERNSANRSIDPTPREFGSFGVGQYGLADFGGNVWEWTSTCHRRVVVTGNNERVEPICGVYIAVGKHRAPLSSITRDPKGGGCSVGTPPLNLGFRLVRADTR